MQRVARVVLVACLAVLVPSVGWAQPQVVTLAGAQEVTFSTTTAQAVGLTDTLRYRWVSVQITSQGGSSTVAFQQSNDNVTWVNVALVTSSNVGANVAAVSVGSTGIFAGPLQGRYFRLNVTGIASGTTAGVIEFTAQPSLYMPPLLQLSAVTAGVAATSLGKAEDAAHTTADTGVFVLGVRNDGATETTNTDADYAQFSVDSYGAQFSRVDHPNRISCGVDTIAATLTEMTGCAAPAAGLSIYITDVIAQSTTATAGQFILRQGTGTNCGTGTASVFPSAASVIRFAAPGNGVAPLAVSLKTPIKLTAANALCLLGVATNTVTAQVVGFIAR